MELTLGSRTYELSSRALVMGILNRTPDSFYDRGSYWNLDAFYQRAERLVVEGADLLDVGGVADADYLPVAAAAGATVVATHIRLRPRVPDPRPRYDDVLGEVTGYLAERIDRARAAGLGDDRIVVDAGLDLGKTTPQSALLLAGSGRLAALGVPLLLAASNKDFLGEMFGLALGARREASMAAHALGVSLGCRILRVHDVARTRRVVDALAAVIGAK